MTLTIKTINDIDKLKLFAINNPNKPLCYVYYKNNLLFKNVYYVGFTRQNCYKYLNNHHKMKKLIDNINNGFSIQIYTKYNENDLITLFKPKLNIAKGTGKCGRSIKGGKLKTIGEITDSKYFNYIKLNKRYYRKLNNTYNNYQVIWDNLFINKELDVFINFNIVLYIIEKNKKQSNYQFKNDDILFNQIIIIHMHYNIKNPFIFNDLLSILQFCKITCLFNAYMIINTIYKKYIYDLIDYSKKSLLLFNEPNNVLNVYKQIITELSNNNYIIHNFNKKHNQLLHCYRICMSEEFNTFKNNKLNKTYL